MYINEPVNKPETGLADIVAESKNKNIKSIKLESKYIDSYILLKSSASNVFVYVILVTTYSA